MILPYLIYGSTGQASAASNYNHAELMEYEGYGEKLYEATVRETTFLTGQYEENRDSVMKTIDTMGDYAKYIWNEYDRLTGIGQDVGFVQGFKELVSAGGGYLLTVGDWFKKLFGKYDAEEATTGGIIETDMYTQNGASYRLKDPYFVDMSSAGFGHFEQFIAFSNNNNDATYFVPTISSLGNYHEVGPEHRFETKEQMLAAKQAYRDATYSDLVSAITKFNSLTGTSIRIVTADGLDVDLMPRRNPDFDKVYNVIKNFPPDQQIAIPELRPSLTCPGGEKINLAIDGSTFLGKDGSVMVVDKNGTATVNGTTCNLNWELPQMDYIDDKPAMTDKDGNWVDIVTGDFLKCVVTGDCKPSVPGDKVEDLDTSLIAYVKNAYEYATGVLKTATDGLKSLAAGAKDLTALFGVFFSWLPKEMVVLMSSGLGLAIGLRLFRK